MNPPAYTRFFLPLDDDARLRVYGHSNRDELPAAPLDTVLVTYLPRDPRSLFDACERALSGDGRLIVVAANATHRRLLLPPAFRLLRRSTPTHDRETHTERPRTLNGYRGLLKAAGFNGLRVFAPLPDAVRPHLVFGLDDTGPARFTFGDRVRRNSPGYTLAAVAGRALAGAGLVPAVVPWFLLEARR